MAILIFPGLGGSEAGHWQQHWAADLPQARIVEQADWDRPDLAAWSRVARDAILAEPGAIVVGHSLGAVLLAHLLSREALPVAGALLVAPADVESPGRTPDHLRGFGPLARTPLNVPATVVASRNDPYMSFARSVVMASLWEAAFVDAGRAGHINVASGHGPWREGYRHLDRLDVIAAAA